MMTFQEIKSLAEQAGLKIEIHYPSCSIYGNCSESSMIFVGIQLAKDMWYWWKCYVNNDMDSWEDEQMFFGYRYSQRTGTTASGFSTGFDAEERLKKKANENIKKAA
jgi:hypothetical protein